MSEQSGNAPAGCTTVAPWVVTDDTGAFLDFVTRAFDGTELGRVATEDGSIGHGEILVGDTVVLAFDRHTDWPAMPSLLRVFVADADRTFARAVEAGGRVVTALADNAFGQRGGRIKDPFGNIWWVVSHIEDVSEDDMWQRLRDPVYAEAMRVAQETLDAELSGRPGGRSSAPVRATGRPNRVRKNGMAGPENRLPHAR
ncbi:VOC family protein [Streptomyces sp. cg40]|uniref:VOC family protein n=1 Tax=Streptomyces sp. cg40 TaxID=3419764 RepID=UPI003D00A2C2